MEPYENESISYLIEETKKLKSSVESLKIEGKKQDLAEQIKSLEKIVLDNKTRIEIIDASLKELSKRVDVLHEFVEKFKVLEDVLEDARKIDQKLKVLEEKREEAEIIVQKLKNLYLDFQNSLKDLISLKNELENMRRKI
jgi:DNA repair exonuclease SbcCD ATPase subunit